MISGKDLFVKGRLFLLFLLPETFLSENCVMSIIISIRLQEVTSCIYSNPLDTCIYSNPLDTRAVDL